MQYHETKIVSLADCIEKFIKLYLNNNEFGINEENWESSKAILEGGKIFCALNDFNLTGNIGACHGDSGGKRITFFNKWKIWLHIRFCVQF